MAANKKKRNIWAVLTFVAYLILLAYFLFFAEGFGRNIEAGYRYNLVPFQEIKRFIYHADVLGMKAVLINIAGNVIAFVPMGYFFPRVSRKVETFFSTGIFCLAFSLLVEILQYVTMKGCCDIDDLILNTIGGLCGYIIYVIIHRLILESGKKKRDSVSGEEKE